MLAGGATSRGGDPLRFDSGRYGAYAMEVLINQLMKLGARRERLEAKVFGGGSVLEGFTTTQVGRDNAVFVRGYLAVEGIPIVAEDLEDIHPRKVYFFPKTGRALVRKLKHMHNDTLERREQAYRARLAKTEIAGDVELF
jgi:chemotaxis protein CheD